jgi:hypothetical protein
MPRMWWSGARFPRLARPSVGPATCLLPVRQARVRSMTSSSWSCSSSDYGRGSGQPQTPAAACETAAELPDRGHLDRHAGAVRAVMKWPGQALGDGPRPVSPRREVRDIHGMVLAGGSFRDAKAQVTAEVTYEPRMLLKTIRPFTRPIDLTCDGL